MKTFAQFIFRDYSFSSDTKKLALHYAIDDGYEFSEEYTFDFPFAESINTEQLDRAIQTLFFMAGVSYYKTFIPPRIVIEKGRLDSDTAQFLAKTYQKGLGEFFYINKLNPQTVIPFESNSDVIGPIESESKNNGLLVGLGGGKDSLLSVELLRAQPKVATWSLNHRAQLTPLVERSGLPHFWVERVWDPQLAELNKQDTAYNGHVPISAIFACVGTIVSILSGYQDAVVSNENSANESTLEHDGVEINHQYSKTLEFEQGYQQHLSRNFGDSYRYFSFLRPLSELHVCKLFAQNGFDAYKDVFSSCNRAFVHGQTKMSWCGTCPKCAFTFLVLTPFVTHDLLETIWGKNLFLDPSLELTYRQLLGIEGDKPLDCIGEIKESRSAMRIAQSQYPELQKYVFDIPESYDYQELASHSMPSDISAVLLAAVRKAT